MSGYVNHDSYILDSAGWLCWLISQIDDEEGDGLCSGKGPCNGLTLVLFHAFRSRNVVSCSLMIHDSMPDSSRKAEGPSLCFRGSALWLVFSSEVA